MFTATNLIKFCQIPQNHRVKSSFYGRLHFDYTCAMMLKQLRLYHFKNWKQATLLFGERLNCITGLNGAGKTNLLDAIHYLCLTKSYFSSQDQMLLLHQQEEMTVEGVFERELTEESVQIIVKKGSRKLVKLNGTEYPRISEHIGRFPLLMITPGDINLVHEGSEERRRLIDAFISQLDKNYLNGLMQYNRALEQRNAMLKQFALQSFFDAHLLEGYNQTLAQSGTLIYETRSRFFQNFLPLFQKYYSQLSQSSEHAHIEYESGLHTRSMAEILEQNLQVDLHAERTTQGIHKDELAFSLNDYPLKKFASQGQQKSFVIALKIALYEYLKNATDTKPLLLLDDILEKLDAQRLKVLLNLIAGPDFGQIFISDTNEEKLKSSFADLNMEASYYRIENGNLS